MGLTFHRYGEPVAALLMAGMVPGLLIVLLFDFVQAFAVNTILARREHTARGELAYRIYAQFRSRWKADTWYLLTPDGEPVEASESEIFEATIVFSLSPDGRGLEFLDRNRQDENEPW